MDIQKNNLMGACDYCIKELRIFRDKIGNMRGQDQIVAANIGGIVIMLTAKIIECSQQVMLKSIKAGQADAREDLKDIKSEFNEFINKMAGEKENE